MFFFSVKSRNTDSSCVIISLESALFICIGQILYTLSANYFYRTINLQFLFQAVSYNFNTFGRPLMTCLVI